jgi:O-antigen/teichoic acid export membrane protein/O-antigen ligase
VLTAFTGQAVLVVSGVIVARMLGPENRGYLALLVLVPLVLAQAGALGVPLAVTYQIARDRTAAAGVWAALRPVVLFQAALLAGLHCVVLWALLSNDPDYVTSAALVTIVLVPAHLSQQYGLAVLQGRERFLAFNILRTAPAAVYAAAVAVLLVTDLDGLGEVALLWTGANVAIGVLTLMVALRGLGPRGEGPVPPVREMVGFGAKGLLGASSPIEYFRLDQAVVGLFLTPVSLGIYAVALAFTNLPRFISTSVGMVAYPHVAAQSDPVEARRQLRRFFLLTIVACVAVVAALEVSAEWLVPFFFGSEFESAVPIVRIVLVSALLIAARRILADGARGLGRPGLGTVAELVSLVTLIPALAVFMPMWGLEGVAAALVAAGAVSLPVMLIGLARSGPDDGAARAPRLRAPRELGRFPRMLRSLPVIPCVLALDALAVILILAAPGIGLLAAGVILFFLAVVAVRRRLNRPTVDTPAEPRPELQASADERDGLEIARGLYGVGLVLLGFIILRGPGGLSFSDLFFMAAIGMTIVTLIALRRPAPVVLGPVLVLGVALFAVGGLASSFGADDPAESVTVVARIVYLTVVWFWLGSVLLNTRRRLRGAIWCWVLSAALGGAAAVVQTIWGDVIPGATVHFGRVSGIAYEVNDLGGLCGVAAVPAAMLITTARSGLARLAAIGAVLLIVAGLLLSGSNSAVLAVAVATVAWMALTRPRLQVIVPLAAAVVLFSVFAAGLNEYWQSPIERLTTSSERSGRADSTLFTRFDSYQAAMETIEASPLVGVGLAAKPPVTSTGSGVHNMFLATWYQAGLVAALGLILIVGAALAMGWRALTAARDPADRTLAAALFAALLAFLVFGQAQQVLFQRYGWVSVALIVALRAGQLRSASASASPARRPEQPSLARPVPAS